MRDGVRHHFEPNNAVALEVVCLVGFDHEGQVVEEVASPFLLEPHRKAMSDLTAHMHSRRHTCFLRNVSKEKSDKTAVFNAGFFRGGGNRQRPWRKHDFVLYNGVIAVTLLQNLLSCTNA